ncbi:MAG TPA: hypothetical protein PLD20_06320 [Blastocatellia bacterium]|nr:hypothetical protein [Blastocatellia bacterium]HMV84595.1 hypothetical protein [Blastocatellia bacterium]HMX25260.1 hypothetical protein [Blastocatellia bacterium]HMY70346.1 hypothetical protein [Blastocatellia bacterium]HMZ17522.1 hypothetical protein [Blastocatellia bacterium]
MNLSSHKPLISHSARILTLLAFACVLFVSGIVQAQKAITSHQVRVLTREGKIVEGNLTSGSFTLDGRASLSVTADRLLSFNLAADANAREAERIAAGLVAVQGADRAARDAAAAELTDIGLPAMTPLLNAYKDRDMREPDAMYHLFNRLMPGYADTLDRSLDLIRLKNGSALRGHIGADKLALRQADGSELKLSLAEIRSLAVRQAKIEKNFDLQALRHCTQIEFLDTGVILSPTSRVEVTANGFVRLAFAVDGWASDADGIKVPGPNYKTNLVDGFPFGAVVGKVGVTGPRFLVGHRLDKTGLGTGRLYLAVNDNGHWQNNLGSFRVNLRVSDAYDMGDAQ